MPCAASGGGAPCTPLDRRDAWTAASSRASGSCSKRPRRWAPATTGAGFLNVSTGQCVQTELPELDGHLLAGATTEGLLALVDESTHGHVVRLLNPITKQLTELPSLNTPTTAEIARSVSGNRGFNNQYSVSGIGLADDDSTVALCLRCLLLVAKPGDDYWKIYTHYFHSAMSFIRRSLLLCNLQERHGAGDYGGRR